MAALVPTQISMAGGVDTLAAAAGGGDTFLNDGRCEFEVNNGSGAPITVTFVAQSKVQGLTITNPAVAVAAGARRKFGPFPPEIFNDASGNVSVTYSGVTSLTVGVFRL